MKPLRDNVLLAQKAVENTTASGLILTSNVDKGTKPGVVLAVGPDANLVSVGDVVYLNWTDAIALTYDGTEAALTSEENIKAIV